MSVGLWVFAVAVGSGKVLALLPPPPLPPPMSPPVLPLLLSCCSNFCVGRD